MKFFPNLLSFVGVVILLIAFAQGSGASLPYQDPTPELLAEQQKQIQSAKIIGAAGGLLFACGIVWMICRRINQH